MAAKANEKKKGWLGFGMKSKGDGAGGGGGVIEGPAGIQPQVCV